MREHLLRGLWKDIRHAVRGEVRRPGFAVVVVLTLALGVGANTAIFTLLDAVLLKGLPVKEPDRLVSFARVNERDVTPRMRFSYPLLEDLRQQSEVFSDVITYQTYAVGLNVGTAAERVDAGVVSGNYFHGLGVGAVLGRVLDADDNRPRAAQPVAVLSYGFWQQRFAGDPRAVGQTVRVNGYPVTIVGVAPRGFFGAQLGSSPHFWMPLWTMNSLLLPGAMLENPGASFLPGVARLKPGVTREEAEARTKALYYNIRLASAGASRAASERDEFRLLPGTESLSTLHRQFGRPLWVLMALVAFVLVVACANVANLLVIRAMARGREIAARVALGATQWRVVRQLIVESVLLSGSGMLAGLLLASWGVQSLLAFLPSDRFVLDIEPNARVLAFSAGLTFILGVVLGLLPAVHAMRLDLRGILNSESVGVTGANRVGLRRTLVFSQVVLSMILLVGSGLFIRSLLALRGTDTGVTADEILQVTMNPLQSGYKGEQLSQLYQRVLDRVSTLSGVRSAALMTTPFLSGLRGRMDVTPPGYVERPGEDYQSVFETVTPAIFQTLGIPVVRGRAFTDRDDANAPKVIIVNEPMARYFFGSADPVGKIVGIGGEPQFEIVGVVRETKFLNMREEAPRMVYLPFAQFAVPGERTLYVRSSSDPTALVEPIRRAVAEIDPNIPLYGVKTFRQQVDESLLQERLTATLAGAFGLLAVFLSGLGLYGLVHYNVLQRRREIGVRIALGAAPRGVARMVLSETLVLVVAGIIAGLAIAVPLARLVQPLLFGAEATDLDLLLVAAVTMIAVGAVAGTWPAWRAATVDPLYALRGE
jgi:predicted permease